MNTFAEDIAIERRRGLPDWCAPGSFQVVTGKAPKGIRGYYARVADDATLEINGIGMKFTEVIVQMRCIDPQRRRIRLDHLYPITEGKVKYRG